MFEYVRITLFQNYLSLQYHLHTLEKIKKGTNNNVNFIYFSLNRLYYTYELVLHLFFYEDLIILPTYSLNMTALRYKTHKNIL
jgi:hypothetical protein